MTSKITNSLRNSLAQEKQKDNTTSKKITTKKLTDSKPKTTNTSKNAKQKSATVSINQSSPNKLMQDKVHQIVEKQRNLCSMYLENLQVMNDSVHEYFNQLAEVKNLPSLIRLNLSFFSQTPMLCQKMLAQNKNIFSDFFKFAVNPK